MIFERFRPKPLFEMSLQWTVHDAEGKLLSRSKPQKCHSYVRGLIDILCNQMAQTTTNVIDINNTSQVFSLATTNFAANSGVGVITWGIAFGTSTTAVSISDYYVLTAINNGVGSGQLSYLATSVGAAATTGGQRYFTVARTATNGSGATITVREVALMGKAGSVFVCLERSLSTQVILDTASATATYTISVTV